MNVRINKVPSSHLKGDLGKISGEFLQILYVLVILAVLSQLAHNVVFSIKAVLIFIVSIFISRETEIFFVTQKFNIMRQEAKETLQTTKPEITGILFALLLPVGTPLFIAAAGAFIGIFIGKMVFGGYTFNVFNPAITGRLFVGISWPALVTIGFPESADNYVLELIFKTDLSAEILSPLMELQANGIVSLNNMKSISALLFAPQNGMLLAVPGIVYLILPIILFIRKTVDLRPLLFTLVTSVVILLVIISGFDQGATYLLFHILAGGLLFVSLLMMTDPFTKPFSTLGILYYSVIFTVVYTLIRFLGKESDGVLYALLFANLFVPLLNKKTADATLGFNRKSVTSVIGILLVLIGTGLFINKILNQRIENKEIVVSEYVKD